MNERRRAAGFSLLELMIALGVVAIIATFAIPAYRAHVTKAHRLDAAAAVIRAVQFVETARLAQASENGNASALSTGLDQAPSNGAAVYRLAVLPESSTNGGYAIEAAPVVSGAMQDDACGTFVMEATGLRWNHAPAATTPLDAARSAACWAGRS
ncbi:type IV pilin protein [Caballeronia ptereochthonis]|uniref:Tfp pilus assembly protein PilE n=1 Tax=Caballeronia ptereochthonis TaxID=1777144 RepID=A0A158DM48_9BURK|nr:type IV pilin protein [Caballeronia ptereochthonis]SAK95510.1 Tfp pilus assembly protein PilE [Caballeronia ptereochthonis]